ncbi:T9SS type A sorting domain-containing protein [Kaistella sp.]|uniref:T9SS type A sorting domain-containing protein n=1 Tax=Kaistella sp. TaxID=2782235 RepID=UPI003C393959
MKKTLLFAFASLLLAFSAKAQTTSWDFSNDATNWPLSAGIGNSQVVKLGLGMFPIATNTNFGAITNSSQVSFSDGYVATGNRFQNNGGGAATAGTYKPTQRYFFIQVSGACTVKAWYKSGSGGAVRTAYITNGDNTLYGSAATSPSATPADTAILTANIPSAGTFYIYTDAAINFYKIEVTGASVVTTLDSNTIALATSETAASKISTAIFSEGSKVYISKVSGDTKVNIYNTNGGLVKSANTKSDINFELKTGVYIVNVQTDKGVKSQKVLVK